MPCAPGWRQARAADAARRCHRPSLQRRRHGSQPAPGDELCGPERRALRGRRSNAHQCRESITSTRRGGGGVDVIESRHYFHRAGGSCDGAGRVSGGAPERSEARSQGPESARGAARGKRSARIAGPADETRPMRRVARAAGVRAGRTVVRLMLRSAARATGARRLQRRN